MSDHSSATLGDSGDDGLKAVIPTRSNDLDMLSEPLRDARLLRDPVITSDAQLRRGPGPAAWSSRGQVAYYRVGQADGLTLQLWVGEADGVPAKWSSDPFKASAGQGSIMDRTFAGGPAFSPDGSMIAVTGSDGPGTGQGIYLFTAPGEYRRLTRRFGNHRHPVFSPDGTRVAFVANYEGADSIWTVPVAGGAATELVSKEFGAFHPAFSPCGRYLAFTAAIGADALSCQVGVLELATHKLRTVTPTGNVHSRFPTWARSEDGVSELYVLSDVYGYDAIWRIDPTTARATRVSPKRQADVGEFAVSSDGSHIVYVAYQRTDVELWSVDRAGQHVERLDGGHGVHHWPVLEPGGERVLVRRETPWQPAEPAVYSLTGGQAALAADTGPVGGISIAQVAFESFDGQIVDGVLYAPTGERQGGDRHPAIVFIHGGPNGQHTNGYWPLFHRLVERGFVILAPNCRGSTGYGREWMDANIHDWGEGDRHDWVAAVRYLRTLPSVGDAKIGIWGRSYGGYSTVRGLALEPDTFAAGIAHFGPIELAAFYEETTVRHLMIHNFGHPSEQAGSYERSSTGQHLSDVRGPLLMLQGAADEGVPFDQMCLVYDAMAAKGKRVGYVEYPREGHGFDEPEHVFDAAGRIVKFWREELGG